MEYSSKKMIELLNGLAGSYSKEGGYTMDKDAVINAYNAFSHGKIDLSKYFNGGVDEEYSNTKIETPVERAFKKARMKLACRVVEPNENN